MPDLIKRTLWYQSKDDHALQINISQEDLVQRTESLVILGEAGMGKTSLLEHLGTLPKHSFCTARQLILRHNPYTLLGNAEVLVIDALDEVSSQKEGDAVNLVLSKLGELDYPRFILSCRVADWRSATGLETIKEQYSEKPLELHLNPLSEEDISNFLKSRFDTSFAERIISHFNTRKLNGLLENPQTLQLIAHVAEKGTLPNNQYELFEEAVNVLQMEHKDSKAKHNYTIDQVLDAAGAAFASLILSGSDAIVRVAEPNRNENEIALAEISSMPDADILGNILDRRLFRASNSDRFTYCHRRIGEFLGARWLMKQANTRRKRKRLLSVFHKHGLVPTSLRGIHAWLGREPNLVQAVITTDPIGFIKYGDANNLTIEQSYSLLVGLKKHAKDDPYFYSWEHYSMQGIAKLEHIEHIKELITSSETPFGLDILILEAIEGSVIAKELAENLQTILLNKNLTFIRRKTAGKILAKLKGELNWQAIYQTFYDYGDENSLQLAIELLDQVGYEKFDDTLITNFAISYAQNSQNLIGPLFFLERNLPTQRIVGILDSLTQKLDLPHDNTDHHTNNELASFICFLIFRILKTSVSIAPSKLWNWLRYTDSKMSYDHERIEKLRSLLLENIPLRQSLQNHVLLTLDSPSIFEKSWQLSDIAGLYPTSEDIIYLLNKLNLDDSRWKDIVQLAQHDMVKGTEVREAAKRFSAHFPEAQKMLDELATPKETEWQKRQKEREEAYEAQQLKERLEARQFFTAHMDQILSGNIRFLINPAKVYLRHFYNIKQETPSEKRVAEWLGDELSNAIHQGFEIFLLHVPVEPTAEDITQTFAKNEILNACFVIIAAFAERWRKNIGFEDISDERLKAAFLIMHHSGIYHEPNSAELKYAINNDLDKRGIFEDTLRLCIEPELEAKKIHISGLCELMHDEANTLLAIKLATEWLEKFNDLPVETEKELINRLISSQKYDVLKNLALDRISSSNIKNKQQWIAISLIINFESTLSLIQEDTLVNLIWPLRDYSSHQLWKAPLFKLNATQIGWIISTFRIHYPNVSPPRSGWTDRHNAWDASEYLTGLIRLLGNDPSDEASSIFDRLIAAPEDSYTKLLKSVSEEQKRIRVETIFTPPSLSAIKSVIQDQEPESISDLQTFMLDELETVQAKIKSDDVDSWRGFYDDNDTPHNEERCRDHLLGLLRQEKHSIVLEPEKHVANDKEVDITCTANSTLRLPIEIKGQWHPELWHAADTQLERLYAQDWQAQKSGIYLVLWFGNEVKKPKSPGKGIPMPATPDELKEMLIERSTAAQEGQVKIFVLDLTPVPHNKRRK